MKKLVYFGLNQTRGFDAQTLERLRLEALTTPDPVPSAVKILQLKIEEAISNIRPEELAKIEQAVFSITADDVQACRRRFEAKAFAALAEDARRACAAVDAERAARLAPRATRRKAA